MISKQYEIFRGAYSDNVRSDRKDTCLSSERVLMVADGSRYLQSYGSSIIFSVVEKALGQDVGPYDYDQPGKGIKILGDLVSESYALIKDRVSHFKKREKEIDLSSTFAGTLLDSTGYIHGMQVGNSRIYIYRNGKLEQFLEDNPGSVNEGENHDFPLNSHSPNSRSFDVEEGDIYLLCSDGLYKNLSEEKIKEILSGDIIEKSASVTDDDLKDCAERLCIEARMANNEENISVAICYLRSITDNTFLGDEVSMSMQIIGATNLTEVFSTYNRLMEENQVLKLQKVDLEKRIESLTREEETQSSSRKSLDDGGDSDLKERLEEAKKSERALQERLERKQKLLRKYQSGEHQDVKRRDQRIRELETEIAEYKNPEIKRFNRKKAALEQQIEGYKEQFEVDVEDSFNIEDPSSREVYDDMVVELKEEIKSKEDRIKSVLLKLRKELSDEEYRVIYEKYEELSLDRNLDEESIDYFSAGLDSGDDEKSRDENYPLEKQVREYEVKYLKISETEETEGDYYSVEFVSKDIYEGKEAELESELEFLDTKFSKLLMAYADHGLLDYDGKDAKDDTVVKPSLWQRIKNWPSKISFRKDEVGEVVNLDDPYMVRDGDSSENVPTSSSEDEQQQLPVVSSGESSETVKDTGLIERYLRAIGLRKINKLRSETIKLKEEISGLEEKVRSLSGDEKLDDKVASGNDDSSDENVIYGKFGDAKKQDYEQRIAALKADNERLQNLVSQYEKNQPNLADEKSEREKLQKAKRDARSRKINDLASNIKDLIPEASKVYKTAKRVAVGGAVIASLFFGVKYLNHNSSVTWQDIGDKIAAMQQQREDKRVAALPTVDEYIRETEILMLRFNGGSLDCPELKEEFDDINDRFGASKRSEEEFKAQEASVDDLIDRCKL